MYNFRFPDYTQALIDHLVQLKVIHWDSAIRELAAKVQNTDELSFSKNCNPLFPFVIVNVMQI